MTVVHSILDMNFIRLEFGMIRSVIQDAGAYDSAIAKVGGFDICRSSPSLS